MIYIDQKQYAHVPYYNRADLGGPLPGRGTVATSGCGMCCLCMAVDHLTMESLAIEEAVRLAESSGANKGNGTSLRVLAPVVAERFGLRYQGSDSREDVVACLRSGGRVIANAAGDRDGKPGLFSHRQHYILLISTDGEQVCILDPYLYEGKFEEEGRAGKVRQEGVFLYCSLDTLMANVIDRYRFHLLMR